MTTLRFYSQNGEDCLLWQFFEQKPTGFFVDVGAFDGVYLSNSLSFEQQGWRGLCLEPLPESYQWCAHNRQATTLQVACVGDANQSETTFYREPLGTLSGLQRDEQREADVTRRLAKHGLTFKGFEAITVPTRTLTALLDEHLPANVPLDFVSIDVEGTELDVLAGFDLKRYQPRVIVIEANDAAMRDAISAALRPYGYRLGRRVQQNFFYVRHRADRRRLRRVSVDCELEALQHPKGPEYTSAGVAARRRVSFTAMTPRDRAREWLRHHLRRAQGR